MAPVFFIDRFKSIWSINEGKRKMTKFLSYFEQTADVPLRKTIGDGSIVGAQVTGIDDVQEDA